MRGLRLQDESKFYLVSGGIASLAALIRDGDITGRTSRFSKNQELMEDAPVLQHQHDPRNAKEAKHALARNR